MKKTTKKNQSNPRIFIDDGISKKYRVLHKIDVNDYGDLLLTLEAGERLQFTPFGKVETIPAPADIRLISPFRHSKTRELDGTFGLTFHNRKTERGLLEILPPEQSKGPGRKKGPGRPPRTQKEKKRDKRIADAWKNYHATGGYKCEFEDMKGLNPGELDKILNRVRKQSD